VPRGSGAQGCSDWTEELVPSGSARVVHSKPVPSLAIPSTDGRAKPDEALHFGLAVGHLQSWSCRPRADERCLDAHLLHMVTPSEAHK